MPAAFDKCVAEKGRVRTIPGPTKQFGVPAGSYLHVCFQGKKMVRGEVKTKEKPSGKEATST